MAVAIENGFFEYEPLTGEISGWMETVGKSEVAATVDRIVPALVLPGPGTVVR